MERGANIPEDIPSGRTPGALPGDPQFHLAVVAGLFVVWVISQLAPPPPLPTSERAWRYLQLLLLFPVLEEILFRGLLQEMLMRRMTGWLGPVSHANLITSLLFALSHLYSHSAAWSLSTFLPSLVFGHFRDRYRHVLPAIVLHVIYNSAFFLSPLLLS